MFCCCRISVITKDAVKPGLLESRNKGPRGNKYQDSPYRYVMVHQRIISYFQLMNIILVQNRKTSRQAKSLVTHHNRPPCQSLLFRNLCEFKSNKSQHIVPDPRSTIDPLLADLCLPWLSTFHHPLHIQLSIRVAIHHELKLHPAIRLSMIVIRRYNPQSLRKNAKLNY